jgi:hypothetical protein
VPFYEVIYETGRMSVANYENDDEAKKALGEHHRRAVGGESGGPIGAPAERVAAIRVYDKHPDAFNEDQTMTGDVAKKELERLVGEGVDENGVINTSQLAIRVQDLSHPMVDTRENSFDSMYKMQEKKSLDLKFLEA